MSFWDLNPQQPFVETHVFKTFPEALGRLQPSSRESFSNQTMCARKAEATSKRFLGSIGVRIYVDHVDIKALKKSSKKGHLKKKWEFDPRLSWDRNFLEEPIDDSLTNKATLPESFFLDLAIF